MGSRGPRDTDGEAQVARVVHDRLCGRRRCGARAGEEPLGEAFHGHRNSGEGGGRLARHQRSDFSLVKHRSH